MNAPDRTGAEDARLVERARNGDRRAFEVLVRRYERRLYCFALNIVGNPEDAREVAQETFLKVFRRLDTFQGQSRFSTWLFRVARNAAFDFLRRKRGRPVAVAEFDDARDHSDAGDAADPWTAPVRGADPLKALRDRELGAQIERAIEQLSPAHREILLLREVEGLSYEELATVLGIPKGTVMSRLFHARKKVQKMLAAYLEEA